PSAPVVRRFAKPMSALSAKPLRAFCPRAKKDCFARPDVSAFLKPPKKNSRFPTKHLPKFAQNFPNTATARRSCSVRQHLWKKWRLPKRISKRFTQTLLKNLPLLRVQSIWTSRPSKITAAKKRSFWSIANCPLILRPHTPWRFPTPKRKTQAPKCLLHRSQRRAAHI